MGVVVPVSFVARRGSDPEFGSIGKAFSTLGMIEIMRIGV